MVADTTASPGTATPKYTHSVVNVNHWVATTRVGTVTENLLGTYSDYDLFQSHKRKRFHWRVTYTSAWIDATGVAHQSHGYATSPSIDTDSTVSSETGADPAWFDFVGD